MKKNTTREGYEQDWKVGRCRSFKTYRRDSHSKKIRTEQVYEGETILRNIDVYVKIRSSRGNCKCKGPEVGSFQTKFHKCFKKERERDRERERLCPLFPVGQLCSTKSFLILTRAVQQNDGRESLVGVSTKKKRRNLIRYRGYKKLF